MYIPDPHNVLGDQRNQLFASCRVGLYRRFRNRCIRHHVQPVGCTGTGQICEPGEQDDVTAAAGDLEPATDGDRHVDGMRHGQGRLVLLNRTRERRRTNRDLWSDNRQYEACRLQRVRAESCLRRLPLLGPIFQSLCEIDD